MVVVLSGALKRLYTRRISQLMAIGKVVNLNKSQFIAESFVYDDKGWEVGGGLRPLPSQSENNAIWTTYAGLLLLIAPVKHVCPERLLLTNDSTRAYQ